jgi:hypothetical protein
MADDPGALPDLAAVTAAEAPHTERGLPELGPALALLLRRWEAGARDDETALRLLFLSWYACAEPSFLTGLPEDEEASAARFREVDAHFGGVDAGHAEFLYVAGYMASTFPFCIGEEAEWEARGGRYLLRARLLRPEGFSPGHFTGRGAYGKYFAQMFASGWVERFTPRGRGGR